MVKDDPVGLSNIASYYSAKITEHGETPQGADWNSFASQNLRFQQLLQLIRPGSRFSLIDLGCGYGALLDYLNLHFKDFSYRGIDISEQMILSALPRVQENQNIIFQTGELTNESADYVIASGIFNVRLNQTNFSWMQHVMRTLDSMNRASSKGFAFNCLTSYSDPERMQDYLFYANCLEIFDICKKKYSRNVALFHDYSLYEFTIIVRKAL